MKGLIVSSSRPIRGYIIPLFLLSLLLFVRVYHIGDDLPFPFETVEWEEKTSGYNARNKVLFGDWDSGGGWYQPMAYMPLANLLTYISFSLFDVGTVQLRVPFVVISLLALSLFYILLHKEYGRRYAIPLTALFGLVPLVVILNRSALNENLSPLYVIILMLLIRRMDSSPISLFLIGLLIPIGPLIKIDHIYISIATMIVVVYYLTQKSPFPHPIPGVPLPSRGKGGERRKVRGKHLLWVSIGLLTGFALGGFIFLVTGSYIYLTDFYINLKRTSQFAEGQFIIEKAIKPLLSHYGLSTHYLDNPFLYHLSMALGNIFIAAPRVLMGLDPFGFLAFVLGLFVLWQRDKGLTPLEIFGIILLSVWLISLALIPVVYYKRLVGVLLVIYLLLASAWKVLDNRGDNLKGYPLLAFLTLGFLTILFLMLEYDMNNPWVKMREDVITSPFSIAYFITLLATMLLVLIKPVPAEPAPHLMRGLKQGIGALRFWIPILISISILSSTYTVAGKIVFPGGGHRYAFKELSRDFARTVGDGAVVFSLDEQVYRLTAYENNLRYFFCHDFSESFYIPSQTTHIAVMTFEGSKIYLIKEKFIKGHFPHARLIGEYHLPFDWYFEPGIPQKPAIIKVFSVR